MATYYLAPVADGGSDAAAGSYAAPWATVSKLHTAGSSGDIGVLKTSLNSIVFASQTFTKNLTIEGETTNPANHIIDGATADVEWNINVGSVSLTKKYLTFRSAGMGSREGIFAIHNNAGACNNSAFYAENCIIHDIIGKYNDWACGIWSQGYQSSSNCIIDVRKCLFYNLSRSASGNKIRLVGGYIPTGIVVNFYRNVVYSKSGITYPLSEMFNTASPSGILNYYNNILVDAAAGSIPSTGTGYFNTINKGPNGFYGFANDGGTGSLTSDPLLVDPTNNNFNLQPDSPYIGMGTP